MRGVGGDSTAASTGTRAGREGEERRANERFHTFAIRTREAGTRWARMQETEAPRRFWKYLPSC